MRNGIASKLIQYLLNINNYTEYTLSVTNINQPAISCYKKIGFKEYRKEKVKYAKQRGFSEYIFLKLKKSK
ncbi:GNAT family N-acetyltransferase [[Clostridium] dakarense]|uniref:GNAT family N-acetyltransferase n=1 Tax=Faecalimicrobium dakarense TaxID=1301100 RepID=UPI001A99F69C